MKKILFLIIFSLTAYISIKAQYYVTVIEDSTFMELDTVLFMSLLTD